MIAEYSVEEVRTVVDGLWARVRPSAVHAEYLRRATSMLTAYAERIEADERAVPDGYTALLSDGKRYWADKPGKHGDWKPYFLGHPPAQAAQVDEKVVVIRDGQATTEGLVLAAAIYMGAVKDIFALRSDGPPYNERNVTKDAAALRAFDHLDAATKALRSAISHFASDADPAAHPHSPDAADSGRVVGELPPLPEPITTVRHECPADCEDEAGRWGAFDDDQMRAYARAALAAQGQGEGFDFTAHLQRQREWSGETFGPGSRAQGVVDHIRKELLEIEADPGDLKEWIDVVILALDGAWRSGAQPQEIIAALVAKQTKNEGRAWPDWRTADPNKAIEHDRSRDNPAPPASPEQAILTLEGGFQVPITRSGDGYVCDWLKAPSASPAGVPDGWVLVPREPTDAMLNAFMTKAEARNPADTGYAASRRWAATLAAATSATPEGGEVGHG